MKKLSLILLIYVATLITSCIPGKITTYQLTINSVGCMAFSFQDNGIFPYLEKINKEQLGISIIPDSISKKIAQDGFDTGNKLYALDPSTEFVFTNHIEAINVVTLYDFNDKYPAMSNVNAILDPLDIMGNTHSVEDLSKLQFTEMHLKFNQPATSDTIQFEISGRIAGGEAFKIATNKLIVQ